MALGTARTINTGFLWREPITDTGIYSKLGCSGRCAVSDGNQGDQGIASFFSTCWLRPDLLADGLDQPVLAVLGKPEINIKEDLHRQGTV